MIVNKLNKTLLLLFITLSFIGCVEPFELETDVFESALVVEATITDELKHQQVKLSRTYRLEADAPPIESNARVSVVDDAQNEFLFKETSPGIYSSIAEFEALPQRLYIIKIETADGRSYSSQPAALVTGGEITDLYATRTENARGEDGIALLINSQNASGSTNYYRYEYEETFEIFSPYKKLMDFSLANDTITLVEKEKEEYRCFKTLESQEIVLASTATLNENRLDNYLVRFIEKGNPIVSNRYSILVQQYAVSREVYNFYEALKELSQSESLFSQTQPGFLNGNLFSEENPEEEKVLGFFSVSGVTSRRIFFSFSDFFDDDEEQPSYISDYCPVSDPYPPGPELEALIRSGNIKFFGRQPGPIYTVVRAECVDCTLTGTNKVPEFWEE